MTKNVTTHNYANYEITIVLNETFDDYTFIIKDESKKIVMRSYRPYDSKDDAYVRACMRINEL